MEDLFAKVDGIWEEEIDPALELICASKTQFYNEHIALRLIKDTEIRHWEEASKLKPTPASAA